MKGFSEFHCRSYMAFAFVAGALVAIALSGVPSYGASEHFISQRGQAFNPAEVTIQRGEKLQILNDDGDLRHHAYIDSDNFRFDSGDQEPGTKTDIVFSSPGNFEVLCAIHPKMKLTVHVRK